MKDGAVEVYLNHPMLMIGVDSEPEPLTLGDAAAVSSHQIAVKVRAQIGPVQISFWSGVDRVFGTLVADAVLDFPTSFIHVFDVDRTAFYSKRVEGPGRHVVKVGVDDPGDASRVHVLVDPLPGIRFTKGQSDQFGSVWMADGEAASRSDLELLLAGHDRPVERLALAIECVSKRSVRMRALFTYDVRQIVEWIRWLTPTLSLEEADAMGSIIRDGLSDAERPISSHRAQRIANEVIGVKLGSPNNH